MSRIYVNLFIAALLLVNASTSFAQSADLVLKVGDELFDNKDYYGSIQFYEKAMDIDSNNVEVLFKYARNLTLTNQDGVSSRYYQKVLILDRSNEYPMAAYYLAESYRSTGQYRKARRYYNQALRPFRSDRDSYWYQKIDQNKDAASWANKNSTKKTANPKNLTNKVNTESSDFGGFLFDNKIYYSAMIADSAEKNNLIKDKEYLSRIYSKSLNTASKSEKIELSQALTEKFKEFHLANPSFHDSEIYFSVCDSNFICKIYKGSLVDNRITKAKELNKNINHPTSNNTQANPVLIDGVLYLFFVSDRPGGQGSLDIWMAKKESFGFDEAFNLGPIINTMGNEITPYFDANAQTLFFSSDWHLGFGKYDIFKSKGIPGRHETPVNIGYGINSTSNDYYFKTFSPVAIFSSNRSEDNIDSKNACCNDLFEVTYPLDSISYENDSLTNQVVSIEILNSFLPLDLFFHNDEPNPNSREVVTEANYLKLANKYLKLEEEYKNKNLEYASRKDKDLVANNIESFFSDQVLKGIQDLEFLTPLLLKELEKGTQIELAVRGFASSLFETEYNLNLTLRRIESLINYFKEAENGAFLPYLSSKAQNGGSLTFNKIPYGEYAVSSQLSEEDEIEAIYSQAAAEDRKIELIAVSSSDKNTALAAEKQAKIKFNSTSYKIERQNKESVINRFFRIENTGKGPLNIYNISSNCDCVNLNYPKIIEPGENSKLEIEIDPTDLSGFVKIELLVVSNTIPNLNRLSIEFEIE